MSIAAVALMPVRAIGGTAASLAVAPAASTGSVGATFSVDVTVDGVAASPGLGGYDVTLTFDPAVVRLDSMADSGYITGQDNIVICTPAEIDNTGGTGRATCTPIPLFGADGAGAATATALIHATFTGVGAGSTAIALTGALQTPAGDPIDASVTGGTITVQQAGAPSPTPRQATSTATATAASASVTATLAPDTPSPSRTPSKATPGASVAPIVGPQAGQGREPGSEFARWWSLGAVAAAGVLATAAAITWRIRRRS